MSANQQRLKNAIRNIALTPEERRNLLGDEANKGAQPGAAGVGISDAEESRLCCDGSTSDSANPGTTERDPDAEGAGQTDGLNADDPARLDMAGGSLSGVTDCATGQPVCFSGGGFVPPEGWDEPSVRPTKPGYEEGVFWVGACEYAGSKNCTRLNTDGPAFLTEQEAIAWQEANGDCLGNETVTACRGTCEQYGDLAYAFSVCAGLDEEDTLADAWPSDGCTNLAIVGGKIVGSKYDPDQDGSYSAPRDSIDLCDPDNGARITLRASGQSDWKTIDAVNGGDGYLYRNGKQIARISSDEFTDPNV